MSLPAGFLDELRSRLSLSQVVGRKVLWDRRKSAPAKGDLWAPCPFHEEKTASFHVDDRKGFYYCFGCHAKGDAISFVRETENASFMEAVEILAGEAGMPMPARDPEAARRADRRQTLADVMEEAVRWYRLQLRTGAAAEARAYLARRGLDEAAQARWELGFAPDGRQELFRALSGKGIAPDALVEAGLCARPEAGGAPYDRFRGRIIFPIRDARGRAIALGGRAMDPKARAKYLNSPETPLFDKGRTLYNIAPARGAAAAKGAQLVVAEGYMDVIALVEAGFVAVAPLGTAITESQLALLWRLHPEPVVALDGDRAGRQAAQRLIDLALPLLEPGRTLRFAFLPDGQDPDDLLRARGPAAMAAEIGAAVPLVRALWEREHAGGAGLDTPEARAALDARLAAAIRTIRDRSVARHYAEAIRELKFQAFRPRGRDAAPGRAGGRAGWTAGGLGRGRSAAATPAARASALARAPDARAIEMLRERVILAALVANPGLVGAFEHALETVRLHGEDHRQICRALLAHWQEAPPAGLAAELAGRGLSAALDGLLRDPTVAIAPGCRPGSDPDLVRMTVAEALAKLAAERAVRREIEEGMEDICGPASEALTHRLGQAAQLRTRAAQGGGEDRTQWDIAPNGARLDRSEKESLESILREAAGDPRALDRKPR